MPTKPTKPRVFVDADVLFAGAASPSAHSASLVLLQMAEITLLDALTSQQVITEVERNLTQKIPAALPAFRLLVDRCLQVVPDPSRDDLLPYRGLAHPKDLPLLVTAVREQCSWLVTFNLRDYQPGHPDVKIVKPGDFILQVRTRLTHL